MEMNKTIHVLALISASSILACANEAPAVSEDDLALAARADSVQTATLAYDPLAYDSVKWDSPSARLDRGEIVFSISCSKCHGMEGLGDAKFVQRGDTLQPPSSLADDWRFADDENGLRQQVFIGTADGMPHWGLHGLKYRDIDAVAAYIGTVLRRS
jgi:mono/diheme cytochrome c family protein